MMKFAYEAHPARVVFAFGARHQARDELERLSISRALLIVSPRLEAEAKRDLAERTAATITDAVMHVPIESARAAQKMAIERSVDGIVSIGGGSTIGLAKAVALETGIPIVAVPTTFAGSEMTSIWGLTEGGVKRTGRDPRVRPRTAIYDPELLRSMPEKLAASSGLNAIAHAMEALYAKDVDPVTLLFAEESVRALGTNLPHATENDEALERALYGAWLAGTCLDRATMGVHHKVCHVLGGTFNLDHASVHAVMLPHSARFNRDAAPDAMLRLARALSTNDAPRALLDLQRRLKAPASLKEIGMRQSDLDRAAELATQSPYQNPRQVDRASIRALLDQAFGPT